METRKENVPSHVKSMVGIIISLRWDYSYQSTDELSQTLVGINLLNTYNTDDTL